MPEKSSAAGRVRRTEVNNMVPDDDANRADELLDGLLSRVADQFISRAMRSTLCVSSVRPCSSLVRLQ